MQQIGTARLADHPSGRGGGAAGRAGGVVSLGDWVRRWRTARGLTQAELARRVPCAAVTVRKIEADERRPSVEMAERLAEELAFPDSVRPLFVACARGEKSPVVLPLPTSGLPAALDGARGRDEPPAPRSGPVGSAREVVWARLRLSRSCVYILTGRPFGARRRLLRERATAAPPPGQPAAGQASAPGA